MSELNITEYAAMVERIGREPSLATQSVEYSSEVGKSKPLNLRASFVRLVSTEDCRVVFGDNDGPGSILPAGIPEYFRVDPTENLTISVVQL